MPLGPDCEHCGDVVHTDGLIEGKHLLGCGKEFTPEFIEKHW